MSVATITAANFQELVENSEKPVIVDFWATWCGPCKMMSPIVDQIAEERADILVGKINVDEEMELSIRYGVASIPTILRLDKGRVVASSVGYTSREALLEKLGL